MSVLLIFAAVLSSVPSPAASPNCIDREPKLVRRIEPIYPDISRQQGAVGETIVDVELNANGVPEHLLIFQSAGNAALDRAAISAAQQSTYAFAFKRCYAVPSRFLFRAEFPGDTRR